MYADYKGAVQKLQMSSASSFLSFVNNWIIWESAIMSWPNMKQMILGTLDKMAESTSVPLMSPLSLGTGLDPANDDNTVVEIQKRVAEFEEFTQPI